MRAVCLPRATPTCHTPPHLTHTPLPTKHRYLSLVWRSRQRDQPRPRTHWGQGPYPGRWTLGTLVGDLHLHLPLDLLSHRQRQTVEEWQHRPQAWIACNTRSHPTHARTGRSGRNGTKQIKPSAQDTRWAPKGVRTSKGLGCTRVGRVLKGWGRTAVVAAQRCSTFGPQCPSLVSVRVSSSGTQEKPPHTHTHNRIRAGRMVEWVWVHTEGEEEGGV
jgi:hypothetical protein